MNVAWEQKLSRDWSRHPKMRHNLWTTFTDNPEQTYLTVSHGTFEVSTSDARAFMAMRRYCTGHHDRATVIARSGLKHDRGDAILQSLEAAEIFRSSYRSFDDVTSGEYRATLLDAARIWSEQMAETNIAVDIMAGDSTREVVVGWMLETYHYIKAFPNAVQVAADHAKGKLRGILLDYAQQERGHEQFVRRTLENLGLIREEVEASIPLVSTRLIDLLMRELFARSPCAALLLAAIVEASELDDGQITEFKEAVSRHYGFATDALTPFFEHSKIDEQLGHAELARQNVDLITLASEDELHGLVNGLHDIKHAFDLQKREITEYYAHPGNYLPRQFVDFFAI